MLNTRCPRPNYFFLAPFKALHAEPLTGSAAPAAGNRLGPQQGTACGLPPDARSVRGGLLRTPDSQARWGAQPQLALCAVALPARPAALRCSPHACFSVWAWAYSFSCDSTCACPLTANIPATLDAVCSAAAAATAENNGAEKKGQLAEDAGGAGHMFTAWLGKFTVLACAACTLVFFPNLPGIVRSFTLSECASLPSVSGRALSMRQCGLLARVHACAMCWVARPVCKHGHVRAWCCRTLNGSGTHTTDKASKTPCQLLARLGSVCLTVHMRHAGYQLSGLYTCFLALQPGPCTACCAPSWMAPLCC